MLKKHNRERLLELFFRNPTQEDFQLRELSRALKLAPVSVKAYLDELEKGKLIKKTAHRISKYPLYQANRDLDYFKFLKRNNTLINIYESGLINFVYDSCAPDVIILFGSCSRGEDIEDSDMDIFIQSNRKNLNLSRYEELLGRKINLFFEQSFINLSSELKNNIINGVKLKGYLKIY